MLQKVKFGVLNSILVLILTLSLLPAISGCAASKIREEGETQVTTSDPASPEHILIGVDPWIGWVSFVVAEKKGFFEDEGLDVKVVVLPDPDARNNALRAGNTQFSVAVAADYAKQAGNGYPITIIMTLNTVDRGTVIIIKSELKDLSELEGRMVACEMDCMDYFVLKKALGIYGLTAEDVTVIDMAPYEGVAAFMEGTVDAVVTWPFENITEVTKTARGEVVVRTRDFPGKVVVHARDTPGIYTNCLSVQIKLLREKPEVVIKVLRSYFRALRWCEDHEDEYCEIANEKLFYRSPQTKEDLIHSQSMVKYLKPDEIKKEMEEGGPLYQDCQEVLDFYYDQGIIDSKPDPTSFIDSGLYLKALDAYYE